MSTEKSRPPAVAGKFYPADPDRLEGMVTELLVAADGPGDELEPPLVKAVIAPHAGYVYSGPVAASAYVSLAASDVPIKRFILVGPAHFVPVQGLAISGADYFVTPLGRVAIDEEGRAQALELPQVSVSDAVHAPEHCLEVQLPFMQTISPDFTIVPLLVGAASPSEVLEVLERLWNGPGTRIIISSDLSHYHEYRQAQQLDRATADAILSLRPDALREDGACGHIAVRALLAAAREHDMTVELVDLHNSGDTGGPRDRVVGYGAFTFVEPVAAAL